MTLEQAILLGSTLVSNRWDFNEAYVGRCAIGMSLRAIGQFDAATAYTRFEEIWGISSSQCWEPFDREVTAGRLNLEAFAARFRDVHCRIPLFTEKEEISYENLIHSRV